MNNAEAEQPVHGIPDEINQSGSHQDQPLCFADSNHDAEELTILDSDISSTVGNVTTGGNYLSSKDRILHWHLKITTSHTYST